MPEAPRAVQVAVKKVKDQPKKLADMAKAYAKQRRDHKLFKSIGSLHQEKAQARGDVVMPEVIMVARCRGQAAFEEAACFGQLKCHIMTATCLPFVLYVRFHWYCLGIG